MKNETLVRLDQLIDATGSILNFRDTYTFSHSERVAAIAILIAEGLGYDEERLERLYLAANLHDIGKIGVPDSILKKSGRLTATELGLIQNHSLIGFLILNKFPQFEAVSEMVLFHHKRFDGLGYPENVPGPAPQESLIIAVADSFDAMTSTRPYRPGLTHDRAVAEINHHSGTQFDPEVVLRFNQIVTKIPQSLAEVEDRILADYPDLETLVQRHTTQKAVRPPGPVNIEK